MSTNTGWWYGGSSPHQPVHGSSPHAPADRAEHVAAHDRGADADVALCDELVVDALLATVHALHPTTAARLEDPFMQSSPALTERVARL